MAMIAARAPVADVSRTPQHIEAFPPVSTLVVVVEGDCARLVVAMADGSLEDMLLEPRIRSGRRGADWAAHIDGVYQSHMAADNPRHLDAVAQAVAVLTAACRVETVVLAGPARLVAAFRTHVPGCVGRRIAGSIPARLHDAATTLLARARRMRPRRGEPGCWPPMTAVISAIRSTP